MTIRRLVFLALLAALLMSLSACSEDVTTETFPITQPLPPREEARYGLFDSQGERVGAGVLTITPDGERVRLGLDYDFGNGQTDQASVVAARATLKPATSERTVKDGDKSFVTRSTYTADKVTTSFEGDSRSRTREAKLAGDAYDNIASVFLWRTLEFNVNRSARYINVVVDPRNGTITRALGSVEVSGREDLQLPSGTVQTWRVRFTSAGVTNTAWYRADDTRTLVKYEITRGPTFILESVRSETTGN